MEAMQPVRPPLSQQPPQRIDTADHVEDNDNNKDSIPDVDISSAYKRKSLKHRIECGIRCIIGNEEVEELKLILGNRKCQMYQGNDTISSCVVCDDQCINGEFAVETVVFIPNKNDPTYDNLGRFRIELPRIACYECSTEYASMNCINNVAATNDNRSLGKIWQNYKNGQLKLNNIKSNESSSSALSPVSTKDKDDEKMTDNMPLPQQQPLQSKDCKTTLPLSEAERDPFDDGFLICTQLVKTGGADQGGLQVGDVFVEFGHYSKKKFPGLKSIANLVRRSAGKEINVVVWRKLEQMNPVEDDGTGRTVFQKLALKLKPLQSHDADGGGVLGAVINTYPLPEMKN